MECGNLPKTLIQVLTEAVYQDEAGNYFLNLAPISVDCEAIVPLVNCNNPDPSIGEVISGEDRCDNKAIKVSIPDNFAVPYIGAIDDLDLGEFDLLAAEVYADSAIIDDISADSAVIGGVTNKVTIDDTGILLSGDATVWDDIRIIPNVFDVPGNTDPDIISYQPGGSGTTFKVYGFAKGDEGFFTIQLPHDYKESSNLRAHVHWTPGPRGNEESGKIVQWRLDYTIISRGGNFIASQTVPLPGTCSGVDDKHESTDDVSISGAGLGISAQMIGRIYRFNDASDTWAGVGANLPIFIEFDLHYEKDSMGSRTPTAK